MLSDNKLQKLKLINCEGQNNAWYVIKQLLDARSLAWAVKILDDWGDRDECNFETFYNDHKSDPHYGKIMGNHRATANARYLGFITKESKYSSKYITPIFRLVEKLCDGNFSNTQSYQHIINRQLEEFTLSESNFNIYPTMFIFKILILIGDATGKYSISSDEYSLFVSTAKSWNDYIEVVQSILRYREDNQYKKECSIILHNIDSRVDQFIANHSYIERSNGTIGLKADCVAKARRLVAQKELSGSIYSIEKSQLFYLDMPYSTLQQIYYGAPGTGKSHEIKEQTSGRTTYRITFHPDTDYASFVGAYKPTAIDVDMRDLSGHKIYEYGKIVQQKHITYRFVRQSFLNAYLAAWREQAKDQPQPVFLIIEEINRGNCAQIFGDLFQLLDRGDSGFSEYPIVPDADLSRHVAEELGSLTIANTDAINALYADQSDDMVSEIKNGTRLLLPNNLYIWATMNTSDQSLFPIDSAFKRRWDWKYIPISDAGKGWQIEVGKERYDWWQFLTKINAVIESSTESEDKKLGYFFCKADATATITAGRFVGKVLFYLWNDVLKDYEPNDPAFVDSDGSRLKFNTLYTVDEGGHTKVDIERISTFMHKLELSPVNAEADNATDAEQQ